MCDTYYSVNNIPIQQDKKCKYNSTVTHTHERSETKIDIHNIDKSVCPHDDVCKWNIQTIEQYTFVHVVEKHFAKLTKPKFK